MLHSFLICNVHLKLLLGKLHKHGIQANGLSWIKSFFTNRTEKVVLTSNNNETESKEEYVFSGIPQASILSPLLF